MYLPIEMIDNTQESYPWYIHFHGLFQETKVMRNLFSNRLVIQQFGHRIWFGSRDDVNVNAQTGTTWLLIPWHVSKRSKSFF